MRFTICLAVTLAFAAGLHGMPIPDEALPVEQLIERLGDPNFRVRLSAQQALGARGTEILPTLQKALKNQKDPEVARGLRLLIPTLERAILLAPRRVTLRLDNRPIHEAVAEVARQTGYDLRLVAGKDQRHSFQFDRLTFWEAMEELGKTGDLALQEDNLSLRSDVRTPRFLSQAGMFRVALKRLELRRRVDFASIPRNTGVLDQGEAQFTCELSLSVEPRMPLIEHGGVKLTEVYDDRHGSLLPIKEEDDFVRAEQSESATRSFTVPFKLDLLRPSTSSRSIKLFKGSMPVTLLAERKPQIVVEDVLNAGGRRFTAGDVELAILSVDEEESSYYIRMIVYEAMNRGSSYSQSLPQRLELQDAKGVTRSVSRGSYGRARGGRGAPGIRASFTYDKLPKNSAGPPRLVFYTWVVERVDVPFEFRDVPLP